MNQKKGHSKLLGPPVKPLALVLKFLCVAFFILLFPCEYKCCAHMDIVVSDGDNCDNGDNKNVVAKMKLQQYARL